MERETSSPRAAREREPVQHEPVELSVVLPVYDEAAHLAGSLERLLDHLERTGLAFELIAVDDGSRDGSRRILEGRAQGDRMRVLGFERNRGKGAAVRSGVLAARGERVLFMDADLATELEATERVVAALDAAPIVFGSRRAPGATVLCAQGPLRRGLGRSFSALAARAAGVPVSDVTCGFKGFRRGVALELFGRARVDGWAFDAELLAIAGARGWPVTELGVRWRETGDSKVRLPAAIARSLIDLAALAGARRAGRWTDRPDHRANHRADRAATEPSLPRAAVPGAEQW